MLAVIESGAKQYLVKEGDRIKVEKLSHKQGEVINIEKVLLAMQEQGEEVKIGKPLLQGAKVQAKIIKQGKGKKILIMKHRPKKREQTKKGHRQPYTEIQIEKISA
ncbi:MAG: 50S ribosomal protein L21 [Candidatus Moranbacteria bacterium]|nr:50S ribosomal protein L21 [Candidatus Moranbacteria bacterium]